MTSTSHLRTLCIAWVLALGTLVATPTAAFELIDTDKRAQHLAAHKGKWVVVNFWATWCAPCVKEIPEIARFGKRHPASVRLIGVALDWDDPAKLKAFAKKIGHAYPLVLGDERSEKSFGKVKGLPTTFVYDPTGRIVYQKTGVVTEALLDRVIKGEAVQ
jgi:thiol-disulfide isomerase/thioredoxin